jgi:hypothetical protein
LIKHRDNFTFTSQNLPSGHFRSTKNLSQYCRCPGLDSNGEPSEYKSEAF